VALHANHPREMTPRARAAIARIADAGIPLVSQTVLLKGVNDDAATLEALMRAFVEARVKPYYLHHGDLAPGTAHFRTTIAAGQELMRELHRRLSGLALPTYVLDIPGGHGKVPIGPDYVAHGAKERSTVRDSSGASHTYEDCCSPPALTDDENLEDQQQRDRRGRDGDDNPIAAPRVGDERHRKCHGGEKRASDIRRNLRNRKGDPVHILEPEDLAERANDDE
jgi:hypothetical protein